MIYKLLKYTLTLTLSIVVFQLAAQNEIAHVFGQLKDQSTKKRLDGCLVQVFKEGAVFDTYDAGTTGKYDFELPLGFTYDIKFSKGDYLSKIIRIDTRNIPEEDRHGGFDMNIDGTLFPYREGFNTDLLKEPLAKASYVPGEDGLSFDFAYSEKKAKEIEAEFKRLDDLVKNFAKLKEDFDRYVKEGDQKMLEKKFADAVTNYKSALAIFPKDEPVKAKLTDAQAKLDAENANKDAEAQYKKLIEEGDKLFADKKYTESKKKFTKAKEMKNGVYEKEMLYKIDLAMADAENRAVYDALVADADKKFTNKDFAVSIEKYKEASKMYPTESYPKDQILKAESALKDMLAFEADKLKKEKEYNDKISLAERSFTEDKLEQAITHYRGALEIKSSEQMPKDKISEIEALIAERKAQSELDNANALANAEKDRIEKEYNDLIAQADELFNKEQLADARMKYEAALGVKLDALYPKSKIETIDLLLAQKDELAAAGAAKAVQDSLDAIAKAEQLAADEKMRQLLEQERLDSERKQKELEEERLAAEAKLKAKKRNWDSNVDIEAEDQVEKYYTKAALTEYASKVSEVNKDVEDFVNFHGERGKAADQVLAMNAENATAQKQNQMELTSIGKSIQNASISENERKKKNTNVDQESYINRADARIKSTETEIEEKKEAQVAVTANDRNRLVSIEKNNDIKELAQKNTENYERKGTTRLTENKMNKESEKERLQQLSFDGEMVRQENENKVEEKIKQESIKDNDLRQAADQRIVNSSMKIENKKDEAESMGEGKDVMSKSNANEILNKKRELDFEEKSRENDSSNERYEARKKAFGKTGGAPKKEEEYLPVPGTEQLKQGVTENSYKLGNKMVTERTVKIGNKVDKYKKVVSKTGIYFFRNGQSITELTWKQATLAEPD